MGVLPYSGRTSSYLHKHNPDQPNSPDENPGLKKVWFLDAQWSTCPVEVENQIKDLWRYHGLRNDDSIIKTSVDELIEMSSYTDEEDVPLVSRWNQNRGRWEDVKLEVDYIIQYIREHGIADDERVIIHWWW